MARPNGVTWIAKAVCLFGTSCQAVLGTVDVAPAPVEAETSAPVEGAVVPVQRADQEAPSGVGGPPDIPVGSFGRDGVSRMLDAGPPAPAGQAPIPQPEAGPPPAAPRPVVVDEPLVELERVGVAGGQPHLGRCQGGVIIGIRPTANPSEEVFGQRITLIEPICGRVDDLQSSAADSAGSPVTSSIDESLLSWDETGDFQGAPTTEVPDPRLIWELQPPTLCPAAAPVLVGLTGQYDPVAPDVPDTAAIRSVVIECAPLVVASNGIDVVATDSGHQLISQADSFAASGAAAYRSSCDGGRVTTQILVSAGYWLDGFVLGCSGLRSPRPAGEPCSAGRECQSETCLPEGSCASGM
jgi:hypothetical protein